MHAVQRPLFVMEEKASLPALRVGRMLQLLRQCEGSVFFRRYLNVEA